MELKPSRITNFKVIKPSNVADSDENYAVMASFNQVYTLIKVSKKAAESSALQIWKRPESSVIYFLQKAEEQNLADSFALWALRAAIRGALSQTDGNSCFCTTVWRFDGSREPFLIWHFQSMIHSVTYIAKIFLMYLNCLQDTKSSKLLVWQGITYFISLQWMQRKVRK